MKKPGLVLAMILLWATCQAQQYPFVYYTPKDGLVNTRVKKINQDSKGRLYFMTYGGLSVFDGARFRNYTTQNGLSTDLVNDVVEAGEDSFLIATNTIRLDILVHGKIKSYRSANYVSPIINQFLKSEDGNIYATADEGLFLIKKDTIEALPLNLAPAKLPPYLGTLVELKNYFLFNTNDLRGFRGFYLYDKINRKIIDSLPELGVYGLAKDKAGQIWLSIVDSVALLDPEALRSGKLRLTSLPAEYKAATKFPSATFGFQDQYVWSIFNGKELVRTGPDGSQVKLEPSQDGRVSIDRVFIDKENIVWISSGEYGVLKLVNTTLQINEPFGKNKIINGALNYGSYSGDTTWFALNNLPARQIKQKIAFFTTNIPAKLYWVMQSGPDLYATTNQQLYRAKIPSAESGQINFKLIASLTGYNGYRGMAVRDPYNRMIIAQKDSIVVFNGDQKVKTYQIYPDDYIEGLNIDKANRLWVASRGKGITLFSIHPDDPADYLHRLYQFEKELNGGSPRSFTLDRNGIAWVGTRSYGLMAFTLEGTKLKLLLQLQRRQGLTDDFITSLACDSSNAILAGTQTGLDRIIFNNQTDWRIENITKLNNIYGYVNYVWVNRYGEANAILRNGMSLKISPVNKKTTASAPNLFIEEIKVNGVQVYAPNNLKLPYTQRNLSITMAAPSFVDEQQVQYSYQLLGSGNNDWSEPSPIADFNFLNLAPGNYTLNVKASFPSTSYPPRNLSYSFSIIPPYWQTTWFRILAVMLIIAVITLIIRLYYRRKLEKQKTLLEKQQAVEKERTRIATDMHDDLGAGLSKIKFLSETIGIKKQQQQPIEEDIGKIREYSHDMIDKMGEIVWALNQKNDSLSDLLSYTRAYASEYLSQNGIHGSFHVTDQVRLKSVSGEFRRNIYLTVKEALHNVVKHAQASQVCITIITDHELHINIHDNGTGFDENNIRPFSNGLGNMKKRMENLGGSCRIIHDCGTIVLITVPLESR